MHIHMDNQGKIINFYFKGINRLLRHGIAPGGYFDESYLESKHTSA